MSSFDPVQLIAPDGSYYFARNAVDLNDRLMNGYRKNTARPRSPRPSPFVLSEKTLVTAEADDTESD